MIRNNNGYNTDRWNKHFNLSEKTTTCLAVKIFNLNKKDFVVLELFSLKIGAIYISAKCITSSGEYDLLRLLENNSVAFSKDPPCWKALIRSATAAVISQNRSPKLTKYLYSLLEVSNVKILRFFISSILPIKHLFKNILHQ